PAPPPLAQRGDYLLSQGEFIACVWVQVRGPQYMRATLQQGHETDLGESAATSTGARAPKGLFVFRGIGHIQRTAVEAHQSPLTVPGSLGALLCNRSHYGCIEFLQRLGAQTASGLGNAGFAGDLHLGRG